MLRKTSSCVGWESAVGGVARSQKPGREARSQKPEARSEDRGRTGPTDATRAAPVGALPTLCLPSGFWLLASGFFARFFTSSPGFREFARWIGPRLILLPLLRHLRHAAADAEGVAADAHVAVALGEAADVGQELPPADLAEGPQAGDAVLGPLVAEHARELGRHRADPHPGHRLDRVGALAVARARRPGALGQHRAPPLVVRRPRAPARVRPDARVGVVEHLPHEQLRPDRRDGARHRDGLAAQPGVGVVAEAEDLVAQLLAELQLLDHLHGLDLLLRGADEQPAAEAVDRVG